MFLFLYFHLWRFPRNMASPPQKWTRPILEPLNSIFSFYSRTRQNGRIILLLITRRWIVNWCYNIQAWYNKVELKQITIRMLDSWVNYLKIMTQQFLPRIILFDCFSSVHTSLYYFRKFTLGIPFTYRFLLQKYFFLSSWLNRVIHSFQKNIPEQCVSRISENLIYYWTHGQPLLDAAIKF